MTTMRKSFPGRDHGTGPTESFLTLQRARQPLPARVEGFIGPAIPRNCGVGRRGERGMMAEPIASPKDMEFP